MAGAASDADRKTRLTELHDRLIEAGLAND